VSRQITAVVLVCALNVAVALNSAVAQADDQGGDGDPRGCTDAYVAASRPINGERGPTSGKVIGQLELRYSASCQANWSRVVLYGGMYSSPVTVEQEVTAEGRDARSSDFNLRTGSSGVASWTRYLRLNNPQSQACVRTSVSSDFGTLNFHTVGADFCV
jgi:hypothetical protein